MILSFGIITAHKQSLGQGNIFAPVCHSVHRGVPGQVHPQVLPLRHVHPQAGIPLGQVHPLGRYTIGQVHPRGRYTPPGQVHSQVFPLGRYTPQAGTLPWVGTPPWAGTSPQAGTPPRQVHPLPSVHAGIQSTRGRYTSYWNAFLFFVILEGNYQR